jgi:hypothetical protein
MMQHDNLPDFVPDLPFLTMHTGVISQHYCAARSEKGMRPNSPALQAVYSSIVGYANTRCREKSGFARQGS